MYSLLVAYEHQTYIKCRFSIIYIELKSECFIRFRSSQRTKHGSSICHCK